MDSLAAIPDSAVTGCRRGEEHAQRAQECLGCGGGRRGRHRLRTGGSRSVARTESSHQAPSPKTAPTPSPNLLDTSRWTIYVSERYGFSIAHPADWTEEPADHDWTLARDAVWPNEATEHFVGGPDGAQVAVSAWSVAIDPGTSIDSWLRAYCQKNKADCTRIQDRAVPATMDGHVGSLVPFDEVPHTLFLVDGQIYAIACWRPDTDPTVLKYSGSLRLVETFVSTMRLLPGGAG
jgi:hypothetical protein